MLPTAVVEQQAKLGVSAEDSKAQRLKRLQARFRDRGGAFVPSNSNPLVDILLARAVSGESPSKAHPKHVPAGHLSRSKAHQSSPIHKTGSATITEESQGVAGSSKSNLPAVRKRKTKAVEPEADTAPKPAPKRRSKPTKGKKQAPDSDTEKALLDTNSKSKPTSRAKGKRRDAAPLTSDENPKMRAKPRTKTKLNPTKEVIEVLVSDDDQTLVDVPRKAKSNPKRNTQYEDDSETDSDVLIVRKRSILRVDDSKASNSKTTTRVNTESVPSAEGSGKKTVKDGEGKSQGRKYPKTNAKKRLVLYDDDDEDVTSPPAKKGKVAGPTSVKPQNTVKPTPRTIKEEKPKSKGKGKGKGGAELDQDIVKPAKEDTGERPPERVSKPKKRKKEEIDDDRPRKVIRFCETDPPHSSSHKLKENRSDKKHQSAIKSSVKDEPNAPRFKLATELPSRTKASKGPPRAVLERIKASAVRHLRCADSEPDELDCLS